MQSAIGQKQLYIVQVYIHMRIVLKVLFCLKSVRAISFIIIIFIIIVNNTHARVKKVCVNEKEILRIYRKKKKKNN